eukprot:gnl/MRDRNA2_/MRDRNA2_67649_c0_seq2.p1 gnl/MRDRNA2_/MRDRNA2_67649_c0~~gnl/MRDRNA2_/MRDRNA2_67649_c0_seq2.p1  ORF type:complete len:131 (+),score=12.02 gnl/MRDRNA2_/MRDRNA2_67649_c0_seq2:161-553(+)
MGRFTSTLFPLVLRNVDTQLILRDTVSVYDPAVCPQYPSDFVNDGTVAACSFYFQERIHKELAGYCNPSLGPADCVVMPSSAQVCFCKQGWCAYPPVKKEEHDAASPRTCLKPVPHFKCQVNMDCNHFLL